MTDAKKILLYLASPFTLLALVFYLGHLYHLHRFLPAVKAAVLIIFILLIPLLSPTKKEPLPGRRTIWAEYIVLLALLFAFFASALNTYGRYWNRGPTVDYGYTTVAAARVFFLEGLNPYREEVFRRSPDDRFWGYDKGPLSFLTYGLSAFLPPYGYKITTLVLVVLVLSAIGVLTNPAPAPPLFRVNTVIFASLVFLAHAISLTVLLKNGSPDLIHIFLILLSFIFIRSKKWLPAGLAAGLAFSAKFAPPILLFILLLRRDFKKNFFIGAALGLFPLFFFLLWDPPAFINNNFLFHFTKDSNPTSLYQLLPASLYYLFPLLQFLSVLYFWLINFFRPVKLPTLITHYTLLLIILNTFFTEIHANHLVIILPFLAVIIAPRRYPFLPRLYHHLRRQVIPDRA